MAGYAKLYSTITESSLWCESKEVRILFVSMLASADAIGFVEAALPGLARRANLTVEEVEAALAVLEAPDQHSKNPAHEGRRVERVPGGWILLNYEDYRTRRDPDAKRDYMRDYMRKRRAEDRKDVNSVNSVSSELAQGEAEARGRSRSILSRGTDRPIGADHSAGSPQSKKKVSVRREGEDRELLDLSGVDWSSVEAMAEAVAVRVPPRSTEDRRAWLRYAVMAVVMFSEAWLMNAAETARETRRQNGTKRSRQAHFVAILKAEAAKQSVDAETFNGIARRIEIPDEIWKSGVISLTGRTGKA